MNNFIQNLVTLSGPELFEFLVLFSFFNSSSVIGLSSFFGQFIKVCSTAGVQTAS